MADPAEALSLSESQILDFPRQPVPMPVDALAPDAKPKRKRKKRKAKASPKPAAVRSPPTASPLSAAVAPQVIPPPPGAPSFFGRLKTTPFLDVTAFDLLILLSVFALAIAIGAALGFGADAQ